MHCFFFGGISQLDGHISFVDKVNTLYENQKNNRNLLLSFFSIFGVMFVTGLVGLGFQLHKIDMVASNWDSAIQAQKNIEIEIAQLKAKVVKYETD